MRVRRNKELEKILKISDIVIQEFPFVLKENTILELGSGKGEMISSLATKNPKKNFLCVEKDLTIAAKSVIRFKKNNLKNINLITSNIENLEELLIGKVDIIWLTFSDPWPKNRHENRRLTHENFLKIYKNILKDKGVIKFKTDNDMFFEYSLESMKNFGMKILKQTTNLHDSIENEENEMTGYEIKWSSKGKKINFLEAIF